MPFLPIVERELRVASRRPGTYRMRFLAGVAVMSLWFVLLVGTDMAVPAQLGRHVFNALGVLTLGFSMFAGVFLTSDCLSEEKREGTLGLLFLTDLKGYDVVLGKLAAASLHAFFWLLAVFPILGLPLLMGGVSGAEFWRMVLVLTATLFLSLSLGMLVSSISYEAKFSTTAAFLLIAFIAGIFPALWWLQSLLINARFLDLLLLPSPGFAYLKAFDSTYHLRNGPPDFWHSLLTILGLALSCIVLANLILPRVWQAGSPSFFTSSGFNLFARVLPRKKPRADNVRSVPIRGNPYYWLATRDPSPRAFARVVLRITLPIWITFLLLAIFSSKPEPAFVTCIFIAYGMHLFIKTLIAMEASRRMSEDSQSGALELLSVTPLPVRDILAGHRESLRDLFKAPMTVLYLVNLAMMATVLIFSKRLHMDGEDKVVFSELFLGGILMLVLDFRTLGWVGMWTGLKAKRHHRAVMGATGKVMGLPWLAVFLLVFLGRGLHSAWQAGLVFTCWFGLGLIVDLILGANARKKLQKQFRSHVQTMT